MDFADDEQALDFGDQFLFGPSIMACPVVEKGATSRDVYLPAGGDWYDFWTGRREAGGQTLTADAPIEKMPLYVRAGAILPLGPTMQHTSEKPADPIELRIYPGADGSFTLYEDAGDGYGYENGEHAAIELTWDDAAETLTIGPYEGEFPGRVGSRTFNVVLVSDDHGAAVKPIEEAETTVTYAGESVVIQLADQEQ